MRKITPGPWTYKPDDVDWGLVRRPDGRVLCQISARNEDRWQNFNEDPRASDAILIAEAGTVTHETGLTPRQLAEQRAELLEALETLESRLEFFGEDLGESVDAARIASRAAIAKAKGGTK